MTEDPYEMNNLANEAAYQEVIQSMRDRLTEWMASQGDKGLETELQAFERMTSGNDEYKQWLKDTKSQNQTKRHPYY